MSQFKYHNGQQSVNTWGSAEKAIEVTPSDVTVLVPTKGIYVGGAGNLAVTMEDGSSATFVGVAAGLVFPICVTKVKATGTTATNLVAVY